MKPIPGFFDCNTDSRGELFIVEGKHAANALKRVRNRREQAILAMQGKVPNYARYGGRTSNNLHLQRLASVIQSSLTDTADATTSRYSRMIIASDPDADGVHSAMLLMCFLSVSFPQMVSAGMVFLLRAPLFLVTSPDTGEELAAYSEAELGSIQRQQVNGPGEIRRFKGLASLPEDLTHRLCVDPVSRTIVEMSPSDCAAILKQLA